MLNEHRAARRNWSIRWTSRWSWSNS